MKKLTRYLLWLSVMTTVLVFGCTLFEPEFEPSPDPAAEIQKIVSETYIPSVSACIVRGDQVVWSGSFGFADQSKQVEAAPETIYGVASVSKLIVVTAVMQQVQQGLLDLDSDINTYLPFALRNPRYPEDAITIRDLLTHRSGLSWPIDALEIPYFYHYHADDTAPPLAEWIPQYLLPEGEKYLPQIWNNSRPGEREHYSNIGVSVLAFVVAEVTGKNFREYCRQHIFLPLGMLASSYSYADLELANVAVPYGYSRAPLPFYSEISYPGGNLKTSALDFARFLSAYINGGIFNGTRILEDATVNQILEVRNPASGLCLIWNKTVGGWYGHAGGQEGVSSYAEIHPEYQVGIFIVSNARNGYVYPGDRIHALVREIAREFMD